MGITAIKQYRTGLPLPLKHKKKEKEKKSNKQLGPPQKVTGERRAQESLPCKRKKSPCIK
jgi:hypothetical protein